MYRPLDDPDYIVGELEFDTTAEARACGAALRELMELQTGSPGTDRSSQGEDRQGGRGPPS